MKSGAGRPFCASSSEGSIRVRPDLLRDLLHPEVKANMSDYIAWLTGHADECRDILDRYAKLRRDIAAETTARLRRVKPCTSVIQ
jgi:hypothetical protein